MSRSFLEFSGSFLARSTRIVFVFPAGAPSDFQASFNEIATDWVLLKVAAADDYTGTIPIDFPHSLDSVVLASYQYVAYLGETLRTQVGGEWALRPGEVGKNPYIGRPLSRAYRR